MSAAQIIFFTGVKTDRTKVTIEGFVRNEPCAEVVKRLDERFGVIPS